MDPHPQRYGFQFAAKRDLPETARDYDALMRDGYVIIERLLAEDTCARLREEAERLIGGSGRNAFEGFKTQRIYNVLAKTRAADIIVDHPRLLALLDRLFEPNYLLSNVQFINIRPGEESQALHHDDGFYKLPRPHPHLSAAGIWAIDEFTAENGATEIIPKSHLWPSERRPTREETVPCVMPAGSVIFFLGTLWHGGGANRTARDRLAFTNQYCAPWLRPQENFFLEIPRDVTRSLRPEIQSLIGYSIYPPFMGMVDSMHPKRVLDTD